MNITFDHVMVLLVCIIFFLLFVVIMTIFDFYKKPSIYELEILNELKRSSQESSTTSCSATTKKNTSTNVNPNTTNSSCDRCDQYPIYCGTTSFDNDTLNQPEKHDVYKDVCIFIVYANIMYAGSLVLNDFFLALLGIVTIGLFIYLKTADHERQHWST